MATTRTLVTSLPPSRDYDNINQQQSINGLFNS